MTNNSNKDDSVIDAEDEASFTPVVSHSRKDRNGRRNKERGQSNVNANATGGNNTNRQSQSSNKSQRQPRSENGRSKDATHKRSKGNAHRDDKDKSTAHSESTTATGNLFNNINVGLMWNSYHYTINEKMTLKFFFSLSVETIQNTRSTLWSVVFWMCFISNISMWCVMVILEYRISYHEIEIEIEKSAFFFVELFFIHIVSFYSFVSPTFMTSSTNFLHAIDQVITTLPIRQVRLVLTMQTLQVKSQMHRLALPTRPPILRMELWNSSKHHCQRLMLGRWVTCKQMFGHFIRICFWFSF